MTITHLRQTHAPTGLCVRRISLCLKTMNALKKIILLPIVAVFAAASAQNPANRLVIAHTNDTHSQLDPDQKDDRGGVARRKVLVDSLRAVSPNFMLIDAGDAVQGTLFFNLFKGEVEQKAMNMLGYDLRILGNHEFDNGMSGLEHMIDFAGSQFLSTNYDLSTTPLADRFDKYAIREFGGRRIGFIAINLRPQGMISEGNYDGVEYLDAVAAANHSAWWLKNVEKCDLVVAITHIGYDPSTPPGDFSLAKQSTDIDIIIGGHSHDLIDPAGSRHNWLVPNADGRDVIVAQVGKAGKSLGEITIDLDNLSTAYRVIPVDKRLDSRVDESVAIMLEPYRAGVDSLMKVPVGRTAAELAQNSQELLNWTSDIVLERASSMAPDVDFAILNKGGLRRGLPKGTITEGEIMTMLPFNNRIDVIDIKGEDLLEAFEQMARIGGNGVSHDVKVVYGFDLDDDPASDPEVEIKSVTISGQPLEPERTYRVATIDYLAHGGDYMPSLARHTLVEESSTVLYNDVLDHVRALRNKRIKPSGEPRFVHN